MSMTWQGILRYLIRMDFHLFTLYLIRFRSPDIIYMIIISGAKLVFEISCLIQSPEGLITPVHFGRKPGTCIMTRWAIFGSVQGMAYRSLKKSSIILTHFFKM